MAYNSNDQRTVVGVLQGETAQKWSGPAMGTTGTIANSANPDPTPGSPNPQDAKPGYLAAGEPGGNPADVIVPNSDGNAATGANLIVLQSTAGQANPIAGGVYYPGPVTPSNTRGWTSQGSTGDVEYQLLITTPSPLSGTYTAGTAITAVDFAATGGTGTLAWSTPDGLPAGLSLAGGTGALTGTPTTAGTYSFLVSVSDSEGNHAEKWFTVTVQDAS